jgi:hypothetical protein
VASTGAWLLVVLLGSAPPPAGAADWPPVTPDELQMTGEPLAPKAPAIYLYRQVDRDDVEHLEREYVRIKILTDEGRSHANVSIPFNKEREGIWDIEARSIRPDGTVVNFDGTVYETLVLEARTTRVMAKTFSFNDVQPGSIVEYRYKRRLAVGYVFDSHWILSAALFTRTANFSLIPYGGYTLRVTSPAGLPVGTRLPTPQHGRMQMTAQNIPAFVEEEYMPPADQLKMRVDFEYLTDPRVYKDAAEFWRRYGEEKYRSVNGFVDRRRAMQEAVARIVQPGDSPGEKLHKIYERAQQVRNFSFERPRSAQEVDREGAKDNDDVEDVWKHGYGNSAQITWLFLALARAAGFEADPVLVSNRSRFFFNTRMENPSQLSSAIAVVKLDGQDVFLAPGVPLAPFGALPWGLTAAQGLRLDKAGGSWVSTPLPRASESHVDRKAVMRLAADGRLQGTMTLTFAGLDALTRRLEMRSEDETARRHYLETMVKDEITSSSEVTLANAPDWTGSDPSLTAVFDVIIPGWATVTGRRALVPMSVIAGAGKHTFEHNVRRHAVYFHYPHQRRDDITIELPAGWQVASVPGPRSSDIGIAAFRWTAENAGTSLHLGRELTINTLLLDPQYYGQLQDFYQAVRSSDDGTAVLSWNADPVQR